MIDPHEFARKQMELAAEWGKFVISHAEIDDSLPENAFIYFEVDGEPDFNRFSRDLAVRRQREEGQTLVCVRTKGLAPAVSSRLIDPVVVPTPALA